MKIIKPIKIGDRMIESSAPPDTFQVWEPDGRDNSFPGNGAVSVGDDSAFYVDLTFDSKEILIYDLASGEFDRSIEDTAVRYIYEVSATPDGSKLAYASALANGDNVLKVFDLVTSQELGSITTSESVGLLNWSPDSTQLNFYLQESGVGIQRVLKVGLLTASNWSSAVESPNLLSESSIAVSEMKSVRLGFPATGDSSNLYSVFLASTVYPDYTEDVVVVKTDTSGTVSSSVSLGDAATPQGSFLNSSRGEFAYVGSDGGRYFSASDLSSLGTPSTLDGVNIKSVAVSQDGTEAIFQASSVQPYNRRIKLSDYTELTATPATGDYRSVFYSQSYTLFLKSDGTYDIVDLSDNTLITQTNPTVTTGDIYIYSDQVYKALTDNNDRPDIGITLDPPSWQDQGPINRLRMFDGKLDTLTIAPDQLVVDITPNAIVNSMALFNVNASTVSIVMTDPTDGIVYDSGEISTRDSSQITGWYQFFFGVRGMKSDFARLDLPPYRDATITLTLNGEGSDVSIGEVVLGRYQTIGIAQYGTSVGIIDFSRKETDIFGNFEILERRFSKRAEYDIKIPTAQNGYVQTELAKLRVTPLVWIGDETKEETVIYGYYRNFEILLEGPSLSDGTITVEGL